MRLAAEEQPVDVRLDVVGKRLVGVDIFRDGSESCLRSNMGEYKTPEHAEAFKLLMEHPAFLVWASEGKITDEVMDKLAAEILRRKTPR